MQNKWSRKSLSVNVISLAIKKKKENRKATILQRSKQDKQLSQGAENISAVPQIIQEGSKQEGQHGNLPNSLETGDTAALSPILDIASKYNFPASAIAGKNDKNVWLNR